MKNAIKYALFQGASVFILIFISVSLITPLLLEPEIKMPNTLWIILFALFFSLSRGIAAYFYKKNVIEDERLIAARQKAQSIWLIVTIFLMGLIPLCGILYANNIQNLSIPVPSGESYIMLSDLAYMIMTIMYMLVTVILIGGAVTQKILMKLDEK